MPPCEINQVGIAPESSKRPGSATETMAPSPHREAVGLGNVNLHPGRQRSALRIARQMINAKHVVLDMLDDRHRRIGAADGVGRVGSMMRPSLIHRISCRLTDVRVGRRIRLAEDCVRPLLDFGEQCTAWPLSGSVAPGLNDRINLRRRLAVAGRPICRRSDR